MAGLEASLGIPQPASTQWEIVTERAEVIRPTFQELICQAAQREVLYNDNTAMKILALARTGSHSAEGEEPAASSPERTGLFTSGIVSTWQGQRVALFFTGRRHAGENLARVLAQRVVGQAPSIQMCDAFSRNLPKLPEKVEIMAGNCNAHACAVTSTSCPTFPRRALCLGKPGQGLMP